MLYIQGKDALDMLARHLENVTDVTPDLQPADGKLIGRVPLFLRAAYDFFQARVFDRELVFAMAKDGGEDTTPSQLDRQVKKIAQATGREVVLVLLATTALLRNRLVKRRVPFVVPDRQMYLPMLAVDLRERFSAPRQTERPVLTASAQLTLLSYLNGRVAGEESLRKLAVALGYSAMTMSNVREELVSHGLFEVIRRGRAYTLRPQAPHVQLWQRAQPLLQSPVKARHWVQWAEPAAGALVSGETALAACTLLDDSGPSTFAMRGEDYRRAERAGELSECADADDATARVERWRYAPTVLAEGDTVDRLSLYISLRDSADERVEQALEQMMEAFRW